MDRGLQGLKRGHEGDPEDPALLGELARELARQGALAEAFALVLDHQDKILDGMLLRELGAALAEEQRAVVLALREGFYYAVETSRPVGEQTWNWQEPPFFKEEKKPVLALKILWGGKDSDIENLAPFAKVLRGLDLEGAELGDKSVKVLAELKGLESLHIAKVPLSSAALKALGGLASLQYLNLRDSPIGGEVFASWKGLSSLRSLDLTNTGVADEDLRPLSELPALEVLELCSTPVTGLSPGSWPALKELNMVGTPVRVGTLVGLDCLEFLTLAHSQLEDSDLILLADLPSLRHLDLSWTEIGEEALARLPVMQVLERLELTGLSLTRFPCDFPSVPNLRSLDLSRTEFSDQGLAEILRLETLEHLNLSLTRLSLAGLAELAKLKNLTSLHVYGLDFDRREVASLLPKINDLAV